VGIAKFARAPRLTTGFVLADHPQVGQTSQYKEDFPLLILFELSNAFFDE
jgi:hypothetical protein